MSRRTLLILGAQGLLGRFTARALRATGHEVLRAGRKPEAAPDFRLVDLDRPETLGAALKGIDLVVSSVEDPTVRAEREILRRGGVLLSQATVSAAGRRLLESDAARGATGTLVLHSGLTGVGGLVIKELLADHPSADSIELAYIVSMRGSTGLAGSRYAHRLLTSTPGLRSKWLEFPPPHGLRRCFDLSANDEVWLSPKLCSGRSVHAHLGIAEAPVHSLLVLLNRLGLLARLPEVGLTAAARWRKPPQALTREPMRARFALRRNGALLAACGMSAEGDYRSTVETTALFAQAVLALRDEGLPAGLHSVEDLFQLQDLRAGLEAMPVLIRPLAS